MTRENLIIPPEVAWPLSVCRDGDFVHVRWDGVDLAYYEGGDECKLFITDELSGALETTITLHPITQGNWSYLCSKLPRRTA